MVNSRGEVLVKNYKIVSLTNNAFIWGSVRSFHCACCDYLTSLEGAPEKVGGDFFCRDCNSLTSLEGAPKKIGGKLCSNLI